MFTKQVRNERYLTAVKRNARAQAAAERARKWIERAEATAREVEWLKTAPVRDGVAGEDLPSEEETAAAAAAGLKPQPRRKSRLADHPTHYDDFGNVI